MPSAERARVLIRDGRCVATRLDRNVSACRNQSGYAPASINELEMVGTVATAPNLVALCWFHRHQWLSDHHDRVTAYLRAINAGMAPYVAGQAVRQAFDR